MLFSKHIIYKVQCPLKMCFVCLEWADCLAYGIATCRIHQNQIVPQNDLQKDPEARNMQLHCILLSIDLV